MPMSIPNSQLSSSSTHQIAKEVRSWEEKWRLPRAACEAVGNIGDVRGSGAVGVAEIARGVDAARVVDTSSAVDALGAGAADLAENLLETVAGGGSHGTGADHADDGGLGAGVHAKARVLAVVILHEARVVVAVVGGPHADASVGLLHDDGEDEAGVNI